MIVLALLLQAAPAAAAPVTRATAAPPERFSILLSDCARAATDNRDVVVCGGDTTTTQRLPMPEDAPPTPGYVKPDSGDYRDNAGHYGTPCAASQGGCQVGFGPPIMPMIAAGVRGVQNALANNREAKARRRDGDRRQPIDLSDAPVGRLEP